MALITEQDAGGTPVEVLRLHKETMAEDEIFHREFAFMSDGQVFTRVSNVEGETPGWTAVPQNWQGRENLERLAARQKAKGWIATWHPAYDPALKEFTQIVRAEGLADPKSQLFLRLVKGSRAPRQDD